MISNSSSKPVVVFLQETLPHYRYSFFNELTSYYRVIVIHTDKLRGETDNSFEEIIVPKVTCLGVHFIFDLSSHLNSLSPAAIIAMADIRWINFLVVSRLTKYEKKWIWWGLDVGNIKFSALLKQIIFKKNEPHIFYATKPMLFFKDKLLDHKKTFIARNTVAVATGDMLKNTRGYFINVGSLVARKRNDLLLYAYKMYRELVINPVDLVFVGDGYEKNKLVELSQSLGLQESVIFIGHIDSSSPQLVDLYAGSSCSVSLGQAGLSILQSFGYSRAYISLSSAVSGGELENIINGYNGFLCGDISEVCGKFIQMTEDHDLRKRLSKNSYNYYYRFASISRMASVVSDAVASVQERVCK